MLSKKHFPILVEQDIDGYFIVSCPLFKGCRSYGKNVDDALANIQEAIELCLSEQQDDEPTTVFVGIRDIELMVG